MVVTLRSEKNSLITTLSKTLYHMKFMMGNNASAMYFSWCQISWRFPIMSLSSALMHFFLRLLAIRESPAIPFQLALIASAVLPSTEGSPWAHCPSPFSGWLA
jgi:hypothetical protein